MEQKGLSRLEAGLMVEDVKTNIGIMKMNLYTGPLVILIGIAYFYFGMTVLTPFLILSLGFLQLSAGYKAKKQYDEVVSKF